MDVEDQKYPSPGQLNTPKASVAIAHPLRRLELDHLILLTVSDKVVRHKLSAGESESESARIPLQTMTILCRMCVLEIPVTMTTIETMRGAVPNPKPECKSTDPSRADWAPSLSTILDLPPAHRMLTGARNLDHCHRDLRHLDMTDLHLRDFVRSSPGVSLMQICTWTMALMRPHPYRRHLDQHRRRLHRSRHRISRLPTMMILGLLKETDARLFPKRTKATCTTCLLQQRALDMVGNLRTGLESRCIRALGNTTSQTIFMATVGSLSKMERTGRNYSRTKPTMKLRTFKVAQQVMHPQPKQADPGRVVKGEGEEIDQGPMFSPPYIINAVGLTQVSRCQQPFDSHCILCYVLIRWSCRPYFFIARYGDVSHLERIHGFSAKVLLCPVCCNSSCSPVLRIW